MSCEQQLRDNYLDQGMQRKLGTDEVPGNVEYGWDTLKEERWGDVSQS